MSSPNASTFQALFDQAAPALYAWGTLRLPASMRAHLEPGDLVQEVWLRALQGFTRYDPSRSHFQTWLIGIAKKVLLEALRRQRASQSGVPRGPTVRPSLEDVPDSATSITRRLERTEGLRRLLAVVATEQHDGAELLALCGLEGLSAREAGTRLGLRPEAVAKRWQRLRGRIRDHGIDCVELLN
jgi:RNA polymerase sigma factor (sigma-70 family)